MEKNQTNAVKPDLYYLDTVDVTFQTLDKALLDCMSKAANLLLVSTGFSSEDTPKCLNLLNFLNGQHLSVQKFLSDYSQLKEEI